MRRRRLACVAGVLPALAVTGLLLLALTVAGGPALLRVPLAVGFFLFGPGAAVVAWIGLDDPITEASLAVAVSLALDLLVAQTMVWFGPWSPAGGLAVLVGLTVASAAVRAGLGGPSSQPA